MKFLKISLTLCIALLSMGLYAQKPLLLVEEEIEFRHGSYNGLSLTIPEVGYNTIEKDWTKLLEKGTKSKIQVEDGEHTIFGAQLDDISKEPINVYSTMINVDTSIILKVTFELKPKEYLSKETTPFEYTQAKLLLFNFGKDLYMELAKEEFKEQEKNLRQLERELESLYNEKNKLEKAIVNDQNDITEYSDKIAMLQQDAENLNNQLVRENETLLELEGNEQRLAKEKEIDNIEKDKEKALKAIESLEKKIPSRKSSIERAKLDIETNIKEQAAKISAIEIQKPISNEAERKLNTIESY